MCSFESNFHIAPMFETRFLRLVHLCEVFLYCIMTTTDHDLLLTTNSFFGFLYSCVPFFHFYSSDSIMCRRVFNIKNNYSTRAGDFSFINTPASNYPSPPYENSDDSSSPSNRPPYLQIDLELPMFTLTL